MLEDLNRHIDPATLRSFVEESNFIEGYTHRVKADELRAHRQLLCDGVSVVNLCKFVALVAPGHSLRNRPGMNVRVGSHVAPAGGPLVEQTLKDLLLQHWAGDPFDVHRRYLNLHPFSDGNGRSARAVWLYMMLKLGRPVVRGFMHEWYYQSLAHYDRTEGATNGMARKA